MPYFPIYNDARIEMFNKTPPDFYREFGSCPKSKITSEPNLPKFIEQSYVRLMMDGKPSCIFVHKEKLKQISAKQWEKAAAWLYTLPKDEVKK